MFGILYLFGNLMLLFALPVSFEVVVVFFVSIIVVVVGLFWCVSYFLPFLENILKLIDFSKPFWLIGFRCRDKNRKTKKLSYSLYCVMMPDDGYMVLNYNDHDDNVWNCKVLFSASRRKVLTILPRSHLFVKKHISLGGLMNRSFCVELEIRIWFYTIKTLFPCDFNPTETKI